MPESARKKIVEERQEQTRERVARHRASHKEQWEEQRQQRPDAFIALPRPWVKQ